MSETVEGRLKALAQKQGHPGSINVADVGHMMQSWKQTKDDLERQLAEAQERVFDLEEGMTATGLGLTKEKRQLKREVRRYKALAERRGEAFKARGYHSPEDCWSRKYEVPHGTICHYCVPALNATPK